MAHFLVINTGGTIGMVEGPKGLSPRQGEIENSLMRLEALAPWREHQLSWEHWSPLLDSSDLQPEHWYQLKDTIKAYADIDGVLIVHGTDTLAYTAAALSYLLSDVALPVVITGSMLPISARKTDAVANLTLALQALRSGRNEVMVAVGTQILPGSRVTKFSTSKMASFSTPNWDPSLWSTQPEGQPCVIAQPWTNPAVVLLSLYPGMPASLMTLATNQDNCRAILLNGYGNGNAANNDALRHLLADAKQRDIPVFVHSQCLEGNVDFGLYAASALFAEYEAISCGSMPLEAALTKLQILCSEALSAAELKAAFVQPVAREWQHTNTNQHH